METLFTPEKIQNTINMITGEANHTNGEANQQLENANNEANPQSNKMLISNKEALKAKIHSIHNFMRNNGIGYGMNALKVFNIIYGNKKLEDQGLCEKVGIPHDLKFSELLKLGNDKTKNKLVFVEKIIRHLLDNLAAGPIRNILFYEIPRNFEADVLVQLFNEVNEISAVEKSSNTLLSGKIYEYFIGRDKSAISELGAYFTNRSIVDFIYDKVKPSLANDGSVKSMIDMFGGSGGFTTGYINYLNNQYKNINWKTEINKIFHHDINEDVIKSAALEILCLTGELPNTTYNLKYLNAFKTEYRQKFDYIFTNPPYGGDNNKKSDSFNKRKILKSKIKSILDELEEDSDKYKNLYKKYLKLKKEDESELLDIKKNIVSVENSSSIIREYARNYKFHENKTKCKLNDKEGTSLILIMSILAPDGVACALLKEGVFFDNNYSLIRKNLIENFNVKEIISVDESQFENTTTKTSIIIFENTKEKTKSITFSELIIKTYLNDKFDIVESENDIDVLIRACKGDIKSINCKKIIDVPKDIILKQPKISLNYKEYINITNTIGKNYKNVKLDELFTMNKNTKDKDKKKYNYVEIGSIEDNDIQLFKTLKTEDLPVNAKNLCEENDILIACVRPKKSKMLMIYNFENLDKFIFSSALIKLTSKDKSYNYVYYIYGILYSIISTFEKNLCSYSTYPRFKISNLQKLEIPIPNNDRLLNYWNSKIKQAYVNIHMNKIKIKNLEKEIDKEIKVLESLESKSIEINELVNYHKTKNGYQASDGNKEGKYRFYTSSQKKILFRDDYEFEDKHILLGNGGKFSCHITSKFSISDHVFALSNNSQIPIEFIYHQIINKKQEIEKLFRGSCLRNLGKGDLLKIKISIPKSNETKIYIQLNLLCAELEKLQAELIINQDLLKSTMKELQEEALPNFIEDNTETEIDSEDEIDDNKSESSKSSSSKTSSNKSRASKKENVEEVKKVRTGPKKKPKLPGHVSVKHEDTDDEDLDINSDIIVEPAETKIKIANEQNKLTKKIKSKNNITN
jgi:type I restriction-modification system DNA methylase subunit